VALGAAVQADILEGGVKDMLLLDVTPLSLVSRPMGGVVAKIIPRNSTIPRVAQEMFTTGVENRRNRYSRAPGRARTGEGMPSASRVPLESAARTRGPRAH